MKVLIVIKRSSPRRFLVELHTNELMKEVSTLIGRRKNSQAIMTALSRGRFKKEISERELPGIKADFILTEENACWDMTK